jgi:hypothetical protein
MRMKIQVMQYKKKCLNLQLQFKWISNIIKYIYKYTLSILHCQAKLTKIFEIKLFFNLNQFLFLFA